MDKLTQAPDKGRQPQHTAKFLRKRRLLLIMPLCCLPCVFFIFFALHGGAGPFPGEVRPAEKGFNTHLPAAQFGKKDTSRDKLQIYQQADADSARRANSVRMDPNYPKYPTVDTGSRSGYTSAASPPRMSSNPGDQQADDLLKKIDQLKRSLQSQVTASNGHQAHAIDQPKAPASDDASASMMNRLQRVMRSIQSMNADSNATGADPQMKRLEGMLDKIIHIQHPEQPAQEQEQAAAPLPSVTSAIPAVIAADQTLVTGTTIGLRMTAVCTLDGVTIPADQLVYGTVSINNDRMSININAIRYKDCIYPVNLQVCDLDGLAGIHIPGLLSRDVAKESADQGINTLGLTSFDPGLGAQAATAGIQAAKTLLSRKVKQVRVSVHAGYQVLLRNTHATGSTGILKPASSTSSIPSITAVLPPALSSFIPFLHHVVWEGGLQLLLQGIYLHEQFIWFLVRIANHTPIDLSPAYSHWFIRDRRMVARTAMQEITLTPVCIELPSRIAGYSYSTLLIGFQPFAVRKDKELVWQVGEADGTRLLTLVIDPKTILNARSQ